MSKNASSMFWKRFCLMNQRLHKSFFLLLLVPPIIVYFYTISVFAVDIPFMDDFNIFMGYLNLPDSIRYHTLFNQHNEHRLVIPRLIAEGYYQLTGKINFVHVISIGNSAIAFLCLALFYIWKRTGLPVGFFVPVPYLLFSACSWESMTMASSASNQLTVVFFALLTFILYESNVRFSPVLAVLSATLAAFTSGAGLVVFIVLLLRMASTVSKTTFIAPHRRQLYRFISVAVGTALVYSVYFLDYVKPDNHPSMLAVLGNPIHSGGYFFLLMGNYLSVPFLALLAGLTSFFLFVYLTYRRYDRKNPTVYCFMVYLIGCALVITLSRSGFGLGQAMTSRYAILSLSFLVCAYIAVLETILPERRLTRKAQGLFLIAAMVFTMNSYRVTLPALYERRSILQMSMKTWVKEGSGLSYPVADAASALLKEGIAKGYYEPPAEFTE